MKAFVPSLYFYLIIVLGSLFFTLVVILPIIVRFTKPITILTRAMRRVSDGELSTSVSIRSGDEMEYLGNGFNHMVCELNAWMSSAIKEQEMKRNMQINLLMSEINPHFIYNTLNTVIYLSHSGRNQDTITITKALIDILQDTIKSGEEAFFSTLQGEMEIVNKYISIQQYRYPGMFRLEWDIPLEIRSCAVLRMIIQPLVENALFHGIFDSEKEGIIQIRAHLQEGDLLITVRDNGIGMDLSKQGLGRIEDSVNRVQSKGIGLSNIAERIQFHFGARYGIHIASEPGAGTEVTIRLPDNGENPEWYRQIAE